MNNKSFIDRLFDDIFSDKPYSEKKTLQQFNKTNNFENKCNNCNHNHKTNYYENSYGTNNVKMTESNNTSQVCTLF